MNLEEEKKISIEKKYSKLRKFVFYW